MARRRLHHMTRKDSCVLIHPEFGDNSFDWQDVAEREFQKGDWGSYLELFNAEYVLLALHQIRDVVPDREYWWLLRGVYTELAIIGGKQKLLRRLLYADRPGRHWIMSPYERRRLREMADPITVYRGIHYPRRCVREFIAGFSWTVDRRVAMCFARPELLGLGFDMVPAIVSGKVNKADVVAYIAARKEREILIDPNLIRDREICCLDQHGAALVV